MRLLLAIAVLVVLNPGQAAGDDDAGGPVIPPGQEELLVEMLGRSAGLPDGCALTEGRTLRTVVRARYACELGEVVLHLSHPSQAAEGATRTEQFGLAVHSGSTTAGLTAAIAAQVRARESEFEWLWPSDVTPATLPDEIGAGIGPDEPRW
jgi:hypothetical protein